MLLEEFLIHHLIHANLNQLQYQENLECFSKEIITAPLNSGVAPVIINGLSTKELIKKPKKSKYDSILNNWKMTFQVSNAKGHNFMDLLDENSNPIEPYAAKGGPWLKLFGHSNSLCARATRAIVNHIPIGEYRLRFFPWEEFKCPCSLYPIESRHHILHECRCLNNYWNPNRESIAHFTLFLEFNGSAFSFGDNTT